MTGDMLPDKVDVQPLARPSDPLGILALAVEQGIDPAGIETLAKLAWKDQDRKAAKEFAECLAQFQSECPELTKSRKVNTASDKGSGYIYYFCPLDKIDRIIKPHLHKHGFSFSWDSEIADGLMTVTCILRHVNGHRESASFIAPQASGSPAMSTIQKHASSMTYAKRQSLIAVLGITTADTDTDDNDPTPITEEQARTLECMAEEVGANLPVFLDWLGISEFRELYACNYDKAVKGLEEKRRRGSEG